MLDELLMFIALYQQFIISCGGTLDCFVQGNCPRLSSVSDKNNWKVVMKALPVIGFTEEEVQVRNNQGLD